MEYNAEEQLQIVLQKKQNDLATMVTNEVQTQYDNNTQQLANNIDFQEMARQVTERKAKIVLAKDMMDVLTEEHRLELSKYMLDCEKEQLAYRKKRERKLIAEEIGAEVKQRKINALKKRYGYMYEVDKDGELIGFIPSKSYNRNREIANWWNGQSDNFRKYVKGTLKFLLFGAVAVLVVIIGYNIFDWVVSATQSVKTG